MTATLPAPSLSNLESISSVLQRYWGYDELRPLQAEAIAAGLKQRDSLVIMPTGGGKSLCYQVPPVVTGRTDVVVSPLISLMKDQVDALKACGYPAAAIHSGLSEQERRDIDRRLMAGEYRLLFVSPERLLTPWFFAVCQHLKIGAFAIDEAHCISQWGHDFRTDYRNLAQLKQRFPEASIHAYTATATERVRRDIIDQLGLDKPTILIGDFDRPNLTYRVERATSVVNQTLDVIARHKDEAVIVYCISRKDAEELAATLKSRGVKALPYHAGLSPAMRTSTQEAFAAERIDVVVATVAFGMGIDRSNVRCVIHAAMPKSIEHYQQETGRAGRDGLNAECVLLYSPADRRRWEFVMTKAAEEGGQAAMQSLAGQLQLLGEMERYCNSMECRHATLVAHFGQKLAAGKCDACDVCLEEQDDLEDATAITKQVLTCVKNLRMPFGITYVVEVLTGARSEKIRQRGHDQLPDYGVLRSLPKTSLQELIFQIVGKGLLFRTDGDRPVLQLTPAAYEVIDGKRTVELRLALMPSRPAHREAPPTHDTLNLPIDAGLFGCLRDLRRVIAAERAAPPFVIFSDATLHDLCLRRPSNLENFRRVRGVGEQKLADFGTRFIDAIVAYCGDHDLNTDAVVLLSNDAARTPLLPPKPAPASGIRLEAFEMFDKGASVDEVQESTGRSRSTVVGYLEDYVLDRQPASIEAWVTPETYRKVESAARQTGGSLMRPVYDLLGGNIPYDDIRLVMRHRGLR